MPAELDLPNATSLSDKTDSMYTNGFAYFPNAYHQTCKKSKICYR
ncbi:MAG: hypothetical protein CM1200mP3_09920 [Chloroflexota bacterium]|nr:MAG: hypothetical protein CM1200mP3_09920 [Chloroflexota bacterium]